MDSELIRATEKYREFLDRLANFLDPAARDEFREPERIILARMMEHVGMTRYPPLLGPAEGERAAGDCICQTCGHQYFDHPYDWRLIGYGNVPFLNVLCDGRRVKL